MVRQPIAAHDVGRRGRVGQGVRGQDDGRRRVGGVLDRPVDVVGIDEAGPVAAPRVTEVLHVGEHPQRPLVVTQGVQRHRQLAGLGPGHPRVGVDAVDAEAGARRTPASATLEQVEGVLAAHRAAEDRVVPVHRVRRLVQEQVAVLAQGVPEPTTGQLPLRLRVVEQVGQRDPGAQRVVDARGARQQRLAVDPRRPLAVPLLRPRDAAVRQLHADHEVEPAADRRPEPAYDVEVLADLPVVPDADGEVRRHVVVAARVLDLALDDLHRPRAVGALHGRHPGERLLGGLDLAADEQRHRALDVVPDVGVLPRRPGDGARGLLHGRDRGSRLRHLRGGQDPRDLGEGVRHHVTRPRVDSTACGSRAPGSCRSAGRGPCWRSWSVFGCFMISQTRSLW